MARDLTVTQECGVYQRPREGLQGGGEGPAASQRKGAEKGGACGHRLCWEGGQALTEGNSSPFRRCQWPWVSLCAHTAPSQPAVSSAMPRDSSGGGAPKGQGQS